MLGKKHSAETKRKMTESHLKRYAEGAVPPALGKFGKEHPRWVKDREKLKKQERNDGAYYAWRREVWLRDNFTCKIANPECAGRIEAHHILGWTEYPELRYQTNNGITLCQAHHPKGRAKEKRLSPYFQELVSVSKG